MKAVIFDLDGVICSTDEYHFQAWKTLADKIHTEFNQEINNRLRGVSRMESLEIILEKYEGRSFTQYEKEKMAEEKNKVYRKKLAGMSRKDIHPGVMEILEELRKRGYLLAIGSSSKNAFFILDRIGLSGYFDAVADGNHITHSKPHPEVFLKAAQYLNAAPKECTVVEDAVSGAQAGKNAGMRVICVGDAARQKAGDENLESIEELLKILA